MSFVDTRAENARTITAPPNRQSSPLTLRRPNSSEIFWSAYSISSRVRLAFSRVMNLSFQLPFEDLPGDCGVRFAFAQFHHLAFEEVQCGAFAGFEIRDRAGVGGDNFIAQLDR